MTIIILLLIILIIWTFLHELKGDNLEQTTNSQTACEGFAMLCELRQKAAQGNQHP